MGATSNPIIAGDGNSPTLTFDSSGNPIGIANLNGTRANTAILFGDSFSARCHQPGILARQMDWGYFTWLNVFCNGAFTCIGNYGVSGNTTTQMLARIETAAAAGASWVFVQGGVNDLSTATADQIITNLKAICARFVQTGAKVVLCGISPYTGYAGGYTTILAVNKAMREYCNVTPNITFVDVYSSLVNPTDTTGALATGMSDDALHPSSKGARAYGLAIANAISGQYTNTNLLVSSAADAYVIDNTSKQILTNPLMSGTTGTISGTGASGTLATSWTGGVATGTATAVFTAGVARSDGIGVDQQIVISGAGAGAVVNIRQTGIGGRAAIGDTLYATGSITLTGCTDLLYFQPSIDIVIDGATTRSRIMDSASANTDQGDLTIKFRTPDILLSGTTLTSINFFINITFGTSGAGAATVKLGRIGIFKK